MKIIEGLKVTINGAELKQLCTACAERIKSQAELLKKQRETLAEAGFQGDEPLLNTSNSPKAQMGLRIKEKLSEAQELLFIASHLDLEAFYELTRQDLARIGVCSSAY